VTDRNIQRNGLVNLAALLTVGTASLLAARYAGSATGLAAAAFLALGFMVAALSYFQMRLEAREQLEKMEFDELQRAKSGAALFTADAETFAARRAREQFERFAAPFFTVVLLGLQAGAAWWLWRHLSQTQPPIVARTEITMAFFALFALVLFLLGKYSAGIARLEGQRLLRPAAGYLLLGAFLCFAVTVTEAVAWLGHPRVDTWVARAFCVVLALAAAETAINLILEIYRPRVAGRPARPLYESRLVDLLGQPGGMITTAAQALDYQFGFKVSETWFYRFLERALAWIVLLQLAVLCLSTMIAVIEPGEQAILERFGRPPARGAVLEAGLHLKLPWPIERVHRYDTTRVQTFEVGPEAHEAHEEEDVMIWTEAHHPAEGNMLVATRAAPAAPAATGDTAIAVDLLSVNVKVQFQVTNLIHWATGHADAASTLRDVAHREVARYLAGVTYEEMLLGGRLRSGERLRDLIQRQADRLQLGARIVLCGLQDLQPPAAVARAFEDVVSAAQEKAAKIHAAEAFRAERVPLARAEAARRIYEAEAYRAGKVAEAAARAAQFTNQLAAFQASPEVYSRRAYLGTLAAGVAPARKYVVATTNTTEILQLNLEDKIRPDLLDVSLPAPKNP
jgi:regulator of protease activity HflC (stomatin/prohibitin superfamily)